jgi:hypothetical protein
MQSIEVKLWDDLHHCQDGNKVPADVQIELTYRTKKGVKHVRLDLTAAHGEELEKLLGPWLEAGQSPDAAPSHGTPGSAQAREFYAGLRAWAAQVGRSDEHWTSGSNGKPKQLYYPRQMVADYKNYLMGKGAEEMLRQVR